MPELYPDAVEGPYTVPSGTDIADGPQAFRDFADSLGGLSDTLEVFELQSDHTVTAVEMGGLFTHSGSGMTLTVESGVHPVGSVMAVSNLSDEADAVITVETPNLTETVGQYAIMSFTQVAVDVWVPNGGGAGGGGLKWAKDIETEADLADLDEEVVAAQEVDGTLWMRCGDGDWRMVCDETGKGDVYVGNDASGGNSVYLKEDYNGTGLIWRVHEFTGNGTFTVKSAGHPFRLMVVGGGAGGCGIYAGNGGRSSGGQFYENQTETLALGSYTITIGNNGNGFGTNGSAADGGHGTNGTATKFEGSTTINCAGGNHSSNNPNPDGSVFTSNITGTSKEYACTSRGNSHGGGTGPANYGDAGVTSGIHPTGGPNNPSGPGKKGGVVVAYPITQAQPVVVK
jgi:hypothetical protein